MFALFCVCYVCRFSGDLKSRSYFMLVWFAWGGKAFPGQNMLPDLQILWVWLSTQQWLYMVVASALNHSLCLLGLTPYKFLKPRKLAEDKHQTVFDFDLLHRSRVLGMKAASVKSKWVDTGWTRVTPHVNHLSEAMVKSLAALGAGALTKIYIAQIKADKMLL